MNETNKSVTKHICFKIPVFRVFNIHADKTHSTYKRQEISENLLGTVRIYLSGKGTEAIETHLKANLHYALNTAMIVSHTFQ